MNGENYGAVLRLLAYDGDSTAQYNIAKYYETTNLDIEQSLFWYRKANKIRKLHLFAIRPICHNQKWR